MNTRTCQAAFPASFLLVSLLLASRPLAAQPIITGQPQNVSVAPGCAATLTVAASGLPDVFYQWLRSGVAISGATGPSLTFNPATLDDAGVYSVAVSNVFGGTVSDEAVLWINTNARPVISSQPQAQTLPVGGTISLSVTASGMPPLAYQWRRNGTPLAGATSPAYVKPNAADTDSGLYSVLVGDCSGARSSAAAQVVVTQLVARAPFALFGVTNQFWRYDSSGTEIGRASCRERVCYAV